MPKSEVTKKYQKKYWTTFAISSILWLGTCLFLILYGFIVAWKGDASSESNAVVDAIRATYSALLISIIAAIAIFIFIKEKIRNTIWMANLVISVVLFGSTGMWVVLSLWALDEFLIVPLKNHSREKISVNKEIDKRL